MSQPLRPVVEAGRPATVQVEPVRDPRGWAAAHQGELTALLEQYGAVLVSGAGIGSAAHLADLREGLGLPPAAYHEHLGVRRDLGHRVYSTPEWAADREQCPHHDQGYGVDFPQVVLMACRHPADSGGAMLLADTRAVLGRLPADLVTRFREQGWQLRRTFRPHFGLSWAAAFGVDTPEQVEDVCRRRLIDVQWDGDGTLHTRQRRAAIVRHPTTGDACWFNDVAFFSQWSIDDEERQVLLAAFGPDGIPFNTSSGDGEQLTREQWRTILDAYEAVMCRVAWRTGDLLLLDNVLTAHGREPYTGTWDIAVAPAAPMTTGISPSTTAADRRD